MEHHRADRHPERADRGLRRGSGRPHALTRPAPGGTHDCPHHASFYPLQFAAQQIGGDQVTVANLTPAGADTGLDPHFWLDPTHMAALGHEIADELAVIDPAHAAQFTQRADDFSARLGVLDTEFTDGLAQCAGATLVTSHEAFGYLAQRYGLVQVRTLYFEVLLSPKVTTVLAEDLGVQTAVLDPLEGHVDTSADYFEVMRTNLASLVSGLACG